MGKEAIFGRRKALGSQIGGMITVLIREIIFSNVCNHNPPT